MDAPQDPLDHPTTDVADDLPAVRRTLELRAEPAVVWAQLQDADALGGWLADEVHVEVRPGARGTVRDDGGPERPVRVEEVDPGRRLTLVWGEGRDETLVDLHVLSADDGPGTRLVVVEVPLRTLRLVGPAADRLLATGSTGGPGGGAARTAHAAHAACR